MRSVFGIGLLGSVLLTGCVFLDGSFHEKSITRFYLSLDLNPGMTFPQEAVIDQKTQTINLTIPQKVDRENLTPKWETRATQVTLDGVEVVAGQSKIDFTKKRVLHLTALDGKTQDYTVSVDYQPLRIGRLDLSSSSNSGERNQYFSVPDDQNTYTFSLSNNPPAIIILRADAVSTLALQVDDVQQTVSTTTSWYSPDTADYEFSLTSSTSHRITLIGKSGTKAEYIVKFTHDPLIFTSFTVEARDNPALLADYSATIDSSLHEINLTLPQGVPLGNLVARFVHNGLAVQEAGVTLVLGPATMDLSTPVKLTLTGLADTTQDWTIKATYRAAKTTKDLTTLHFYNINNLTPPYRPDSYANQIYGTDLSPALGVIDWDPSSTTKFPSASIYWEIETTGARASAQGKTLVLGTLPAVFSQDNWIDLTNPVVLTIQAEDGSTRTFSVTMEKP